MAGLVPAIHANRPRRRRRTDAGLPCRRGVDGRDEPGHDAGPTAAQVILMKDLLLRDPRIIRLLDALSHTGGETRIVGGAVRDALLDIRRMKSISPPPPCPRR